MAVVDQVLSFFVSPEKRVDLAAEYFIAAAPVLQIFGAPVLRLVQDAGKYVLYFVPLSLIHFSLSG